MGGGLYTRTGSIVSFCPTLSGLIVPICLISVTGRLSMRSDSARNSGSQLIKIHIFSGMRKIFKEFRFSWWIGLLFAYVCGHVSRMT